MKNSVQLISPQIREMMAGMGLEHEIKTILASSLLGADRIKSIARFAQSTKEVPGVTAEIGCAAGGTSRLIALLNGGKTHWACDTFTGLVDVSAMETDLHNGAFFSSGHTTVRAVSRLLEDLPNARVVKGVFPHEAPAEMLNSRYAMLHLDVDTYKSMRDCFDVFSKLMSPGGIMVLDDVVSRKGTIGGRLAWRQILAEPHHGWEVIEENSPQAVVWFK